MRYYRTNVTDEQAGRLVELASERMHRFAWAEAGGDEDQPVQERAGRILSQLETHAPLQDCGMSRAIDELGLWTDEARAIGCGRSGRGQA